MNKANGSVQLLLQRGKYAYTQIPMGIACAPDMFQSIMQDILGDLYHILIYIHDVLVLQLKNKTKEEHLKYLEEVLYQLEE